MAITTRQGLADYALRKLGAPVINVEVDATQIDDSITDALEFYIENHFDGVTRDYYVRKVSGTEVTVADSTGFTAGNIIQNTAGTTATIYSVSGNIITINHQIGETKFAINQTVTSNSGASSTISAVTLGDVDKGYLPAEDNIVGVTKILNITSVLGSSDYMFNMQYQLMMTELQALTKAGASMYWQTMNYLGHLDFIMKKEKNFNFNRRTNKLYLDVSWGVDVRVGDYVVAEVYRAVDESNTEVYNDIWLKRYVTALLKRQLGTNTKKYANVQLPGGITYTGQQIFDEAVQEIEALEQDAINRSAPLEFAVG